MPEKTLQTRLLPRDHRFSELIEFFSNRTFVDKLNEPNFTVGDINLSSRVISHWSKNNILPDGLKGEKGWHKFNLTEVVWLKIASKLRNFGFSLKNISKIKKQILWFSKKNKEQRNYALLNSYITYAWITAMDAFVIVLADSTADIGLSLEIELAKEKLLPNQRDMLLISIKGILNEIGIIITKTDMLMPLKPSEILTLDALKSTVRGKSEVNIKFKKGQIEEIEKKDIVSENPDLKILDNFFRENSGFGEITTKYAQGKIQSAEVKRRQRFK